MAARSAVLGIIVILSAGLSLALWWCGAASAAGCSNELRREEQNATYLPDCRAFEMVSPLDKNGSDVTGLGPVTEASIDGERVTFMAQAGFAGTTGSGGTGLTQYLAVREEGAGWRSHGITPTPALESFQLFGGDTIDLLFSDDLARSLVSGYELQGATEDVPKGTNYYIQDNDTRALQTVTKDLGSGSLPSEFSVVGQPVAASSDLGVVAFSLGANLLPGLTGSDRKLYAWDHNTLTVAGVLPDGSVPTEGATLPQSTGGDYVSVSEGTVSRDGSRIVFVAPASGSGKQLYLRRDGASTAWVSQSEASTPDPEPQNVTFEAMTPDGHKVLFATSDKLLDSDPGGAELGLYMYTDGPNPEAESNLSFIARVNGSPAASLVTGMSEDGDRVYFFTREAPGFSRTGTYLWDEGVTHFVAPTLGPLQRIAPPNSTQEGAGGQAEVSADGRHLAFLDDEQLDGATGVKTSLQMMYVYDEQREALTCVSCPAGGSPATSNAEVEPKATRTLAAGSNTGFRARFLSSDGRRVFFSTADPLVPQDTNGLDDVYEYDVETGTVSLLSSGTGDDGAWLAAASASGDDVFFVTRGPLVGWDTDTLVDLYDARVGGGFPEPQPSTGGCVGDECQGVPSAAPSFNVSSGFNGLGNIAPPPPPQKAAPRTKRVSRAQQLALALRACARKPAAKRRGCQARARKRYGRKKADRSSAAGRLGRRGRGEE